MLLRITPKEISARLAEQAEHFCRYLLPEGRILSGEYCVGSTNGDAGQSCKIHLHGEKAGVWCDFANGTDKGDLLDLITYVHNCDLSQAIKEAKDWLGIRDPISAVAPRRYSKAPRVINGVKLLTPLDPVFQYLTGSRFIRLATIEAFKVRARQREIVFPSYSPANELENVKYISIDRENGKKQVRQEPGCAPALFGWQAIAPHLREILITEGQLDAMTWHQMGYPAMSVPSGTGDSSWIDYEWERLERFDTIYLSFDSDKEGQKAVEEVATRLGRHRCLKVILPGFKDANEALQGGALNDVFSQAVARAMPFIPQHLKRPNEFSDRVLARFYPKEGIEPGLFHPIFKKLVGFRPGELTVWTGISSHGKSSLLSMIIVGALQSNYRAAIASMEMTAVQSLHRMLCQISGLSLPLPEQISSILEWLSGRLWIFDVMGNVKTGLLLELMEYSVARYGVEHFVIDSLMKCDVTSDDYDGQRRFCDALATFAKQHLVHIHLVAHSRKSMNESTIVGKLDVKGSSDIINQADNCLTVWRNKEKEEKKRSGLKVNGEPDTIVFCDKQRETGIEGRFPLWYDPTTFRFEEIPPPQHI